MKRQSKHDIFISYQWDNQKEVMLIRTKLEQAGFSCWMDIGQMGGGDQLYNEIYKGIFHAQVHIVRIPKNYLYHYPYFQVMLVFISPRFVLSDYCLKEVNLADLLRLPIIPVMIEKTPWPPPGSIALILSQHIYVDLAGTGGHGGCGRDADWSMKMRELIRRLRLYTSKDMIENSVTKPAVFEVVEAVEAAPVGSSIPLNETMDENDNAAMTESFDTEEPQWEQEQGGPRDVPCCVRALTFPSFCVIL